MTSGPVVSETFFWQISRRMYQPNASEGLEKSAMVWKLEGDVELCLLELLSIWTRVDFELSRRSLSTADGKSHTVFEVLIEAALTFPGPLADTHCRCVCRFVWLSVCACVLEQCDSLANLRMEQILAGEMIKRTVRVCGSSVHFVEHRCLLCK